MDTRAVPEELERDPPMDPAHRGRSRAVGTLKRDSSAGVQRGGDKTAWRGEDGGYELLGTFDNYNIHASFHILTGE